VSLHIAGRISSETGRIAGESSRIPYSRPGVPQGSLGYSEYSFFSLFPPRTQRNYALPRGITFASHIGGPRPVRRRGKYING
jgi:hypothetical protein